MMRAMNLKFVTQTVFGLFLIAGMSGMAHGQEAPPMEETAPLFELIGAINTEFASKQPIRNLIAMTLDLWGDSLDEWETQMLLEDWLPWKELWQGHNAGLSQYDSFQGGANYYIQTVMQSISGKTEIEQETFRQFHAGLLTLLFQVINYDMDDPQEVIDDYNDWMAAAGAT